ncbi:MAG: YfcE family phosphodiesterase [Oscillospiraceae bacterium]|nr:YfcE family phosphodiesterase [Oscillospiraceae bacterium]
MKIVAFSDSHGDFTALERIYKAQPRAECYIHLGDGLAEALALRERHPEMPLVPLKGNCDYRAKDAADTKLLEPQEGLRVLCTHGHRFHVKHGLGVLIEAAEGMGVSAVLFGHTHEPFCRRIGDIWFVNPGRASGWDGLYFATLDFEKGVLIPNLARIEA